MCWCVGVVQGWCCLGTRGAGPGRRSQRAVSGGCVAVACGGGWSKHDLCATCCGFFCQVPNLSFVFARRRRESERARAQHSTISILCAPPLRDALLPASLMSSYRKVIAYSTVEAAERPELSDRNPPAGSAGTRGLLLPALACSVLCGVWLRAHAGLCARRAHTSAF